MRLNLTRSLLLLPILMLAARAPAADEGLTPLQVAKLRLVESARISLDGGSIAYVLHVPRKPLEDDDGPAWQELHVVTPDGKSRPFVSGEVNVSEVAWTPDGSGISFLAKRGKDEHKALYVIPLDGGEARRVLKHDEAISSYSWAPDGKRVAFLGVEKKPKEKKELEDKGATQVIYEEDWRPVKVWIADTSAEKPEPKALELEGSASELRWAPTGERIAVALAPTPLVDDSYMYRVVHVVDSSGAAVAKLDNVGKLGSFEWSPDATHLALINAADLNDPSPGRLMVAAVVENAGSAESKEAASGSKFDVESMAKQAAQNVARRYNLGGALRDLLPGYEGEVSAIAWQDADTIMYISSEGVWTTFGEVRRDGTQQKTIVPTGGPILRNFSLSRDGQSGAFVADSPQHALEVYAMRHGEPAPRRLTDNNPWLADVRLATQEVVTHKARDGLRLEGVLIRPLNETKGQRYPLVLLVHGGPEAHVSNGWVTRYAEPGQVYAARGIAAFYPNYRGSTGRGVEFSKLGQADPAGKEFDDLVDAVDHFVQAGLADRDKVGVAGGSYGGYATAWCSTHYSDRFAAGVMFVGISNKISKTGTTDIADEEFLVHARKRPWDNWQLFLERSPIYHVEKSRTPLLIMGGQDDPRVHPGQSLELFRFLKIRNQAPVRLVQYPGEQHGNRRAVSRLDFMLRQVRWMEHYLKGPGGEPPDYEIDYGVKPEEETEEPAPKAPDPATQPAEPPPKPPA